MSYKLSESVSYSRNFKNLIMRPSLERRIVLFGFNCDREVRHSVFIFKHHFQSCTVHSREQIMLTTLLLIGTRGRKTEKLFLITVKTFLKIPQHGIRKSLNFSLPIPSPR